MLKNDAIKHYGSQAAIGRVVGLGKAAVSKWPELVPEGYAAILHVRTDGQLLYDPADYGHSQPAVALSA